MYTKSDLKQFKRRGIKPEQIENQLENFKQGFDFVQIRDAATINNGIYGLNDEQKSRWIHPHLRGKNEFIENRENGSGLRFRITHVQNAKYVFQHVHG